MTNHQQKSGKQEGAVELRAVCEIAPEKTANTIDGSDMTIDPQLNRFSGDEFVPEKYKEAEALLVNSILPRSTSSFK